MTRAEFIEKNKHLFWYIKKDKIQDIGNEVLVEFVFNYGTWDDVKELIKIIGFDELKSFMIIQLIERLRILCPNSGTTPVD